MNGGTLELVMNPSTAGRNLPPLAGLCMLHEAMKPGLPVEECIRRLNRYHYITTGGQTLIERPVRIGALNPIRPCSFYDTNDATVCAALKE